MTAVAFERDDWRKYLNYRKRLPKRFFTVNGWPLSPEKEARDEFRDHPPSTYNHLKSPGLLSGKCFKYPSQSEGPAI
jgi:hypothetical protein